MNVEEQIKKNLDREQASNQYDCSHSAHGEDLFCFHSIEGYKNTMLL